MRLACPACGAEMTLDVLLNVEGAREAVLAALALPAPLGKLLVQYLTLFRPPKRQLSWERVATLLTDLALPIAEARLERGGRVWPAPLEVWRAALEEIVTKRDKLTLPLKSNGYLFEIVVGLAHKAEGAKETLREQNRAYAYSQDRGTGAGAVGAVVSAAVSKEMPASVRARLAELGHVSKRKPGGVGDGE